MVDMSPLLRVALSFTFGAFLCYSISIWSGQLSGQLRGWHVVMLWVGFGCDVGGSGLMTIIAGKFDLNLHGLAGYTAITLMLVLALCATRLYQSKRERRFRAFHYGSVFVWLLWMIPLANGLISMLRR
jgi:uncharacterized repeat protein (TIGR03987 family)